MTKSELAKKIFEISHLTGTFTLRSGKIASEYFDKYRFEASPVLLREIARQMAPLIPKDCEALAGLEMGGIPLATALSLETGLPCVFVRKEAKAYGTCQFAEGLDIKGKKITIIEDVVTTGGQVVLSAADLKGTGALIQAVLCVIDRGEDSIAKMKEKGLTLKPLFTAAELKQS